MNWWGEEGGEESSQRDRIDTWWVRELNGLTLSGSLNGGASDGRRGDPEYMDRWKPLLSWGTGVVLKPGGKRYIWGKRKIWRGEIWNGILNVGGVEERGRDQGLSRDSLWLFFKNCLSCYVSRSQNIFSFLLPSANYCKWSSLLPSPSWLFLFACVWSSLPKITPLETCN